MPNDLNATLFQGVWVDVLTPLQEDLKIDETKLCAHLRNLSAKGLEHFVLFGQAGEGSSFSADEKLSAAAHVISIGVETTHLLLGVQSSSFSEVAQFIHKAHALGVRKFLVSAPQYGLPFSHIALFDYFDQLIKQVNLHDWQLFIHQLGGNNHSADLPEVSLADLRKTHPHTFVGIVDQDIHVNHTVDLMRTFGTELAIASCHEPNLSILKPTVCVSALANVIPKIMQHLMVKETTTQAVQIAGMKVAKPDDRMMELMTLLGNYPAIAALKLMLSQHYRIESWQYVRPPQPTMTQELSVALLGSFKTFNLQANE
jgi:dihydrodipicolinate synthase/N-acetylneuraminate lyase